MKPCEECANVGYLACKSCNRFNNFEPRTIEREKNENCGADTRESKSCIECEGFGRDCKFCTNEDEE